MTELSKEILTDRQVRKTKKQKTAFIELIQSHIPEAKLEQKGSTRNIVIGDTDSARVVCTAHYDTCAVMPLPNFITPKNIPIYIVYQLLLTVILLLPGLVAAWAVDRLTDNFLLAYWVALILIWATIILMMAGPANRHTVNDNSSGVITVLEAYFAMSPELREKCAFVLFDKEETGLVGSGMFKKMHKETMTDKLLLNFDCVSDGDHLLFVKPKKLPEDLAQLLESAFLPRGEKSVMFESAAKCFYPSDQKHFKRGVGVAALKHSPIVGYYMDRIHTPRDTVFDEANIELLRDGTVKLAEKL